MTTMLSFLFVLGVLVFVHELGHFLVARWYGVRVLTFSLGFGPKIFKFTRGDTEYCISAIPLGGYVKMAGETVEENLSGAPDEFLSKSKWIRFQVYLAGPVMNVLLAIVLGAVVLSQGADVPLYESSAAVVGSVREGGPAAAAGIVPGDRVVSVDGRPVATWNDLDLEIKMRVEREMTLLVARGDEEVSIRLTPDAVQSAVGRFDLGDIGIGPVERPQIQGVFAGSPAERGGLRAGDVVLAFADDRAPTRQGIIDRIKANPGVELQVIVERAGAQVPLLVVPEGEPGAALIGAQLSEGELRRIDPSAMQAFQMSVQQNWESTRFIGRTLRGLFTAETPVEQLMGPVAIADMSGAMARAGWIALVSFMASLSLNLGIINLMPVPVLDGGHILILIVEGIARRDISVRVKERVLTAGAIAIVLLMVTVIFNDVSRLLR